MPVKDWTSNRFFIPRQNAYSLNSTSSFFSRLAFNLPLIYSHYAIILPKCFMKSTFFRNFAQSLKSEYNYGKERPSVRCSVS